VTARALPALLRIVEEHCDQRILIVSHKATIRLLLSTLLGFDPRKYRDRLDQSPCALNILDFKDLIHVRLTLFNDTSHYCYELPEVPHGRLSKTWSNH
jgi:probable phosphoglycerate mutase